MIVPIIETSSKSGLGRPVGVRLTVIENQTLSLSCVAIGDIMIITIIIIIINDTDEDDDDDDDVKDDDDVDDVGLIRRASSTNADMVAS